MAKAAELWAMGEAEATWRRAVGGVITVSVGVLMVVLPGRAQALSSRLEQWQLEGTLAALRDPDEAVWVRALTALGEYELTRDQQRQLLADERYRDIVGLLADDQSDALQASALRAIAVTGHGSVQTSLQIVPLLHDRDAGVRQAAIEALARQQDRSYLQHILYRLYDREWMVRQAAIRAIGLMGDSEHVSYLIPFLSPPEPTDGGDLRPDALQALVELDASDRSADILPLLFNGNANLRQAAIQALGQLQARDRIPDLLRLLQDPRWQVREAASQALGVLDASTEIPRIAPLLQSPSWPVRQVAVQTLAQLNARDSVPLIVRRLGDDEAEVRAAAALALGQLGSVELGDRLVLLAQDDTVAVRQAAVTALGQLGSGEYGDELVVLLEDPDSTVRQATIRTLAKLRAREALPFLLPLLRDRDANVRQATVEAMGLLEARNALPQLLPLLMDESVAVHRAAGRTVGRLMLSERSNEEVANTARDGPYAIESILALLDRHRWTVRQVGLKIVGYIEAREHIPQVLMLLQDSRPEVRQTALLTWEQFAPHTQQTLVPLLDSMYGDSLTERSQLRFSAYLGSGGVPESVTAIRWLGRPLQRPAIETNAQRIELLEQLYRLWPDTAEFDNLRTDVAHLMAQLVEDGDWQRGLLQGSQHRVLLAKLETLLRQDGFTFKANTVRSAYGSFWQDRQLTLLRRYAMGHAITWLVMWLLYPMCLPIQIVVWHPWLRRILGHGYVGWLLTRVPFLRARLFVPWTVSSSLLHADLAIRSERTVPSIAAIEARNVTRDRTLFDYRLQIASTSFPACDIDEPATENSIRAVQTRNLKLFPTHMRSRHSLWVHLQAEYCVAGVETAIRAEVGRACPIVDLDPGFFTALIRHGALSICLEQLDRATPQAHNHINTFAKRYPRVPIQVALFRTDVWRQHSFDQYSGWKSHSLNEGSEPLNPLLPLKSQAERSVDSVQEECVVESNTLIDGTGHGP